VVQQVREKREPRNGQQLIGDGRVPVRGRRSIIRLKVGPVGNSTGVTLPKEVTERLKIKNGDTIYLTESPEGYCLTAFDSEFEEQMEVAESIMRRYRDGLRQLAK
jgi:putative addiction module antidote